MSIRQDTEQVSPLSLYVAYDFLPVYQHTRMLNAIAGVYSQVASASEIRDLPHVFRHYYSTLCIGSVSTGNSIEIKFGPKGQHEVRFIIKNGDLIVQVPRWTVSLCVAGLILTGGLWAYEKWLDIALKHTQIHESREATELNRIQKERAVNEIERLRREIQFGDDSRRNKIREHLRRLQDVANSPNIKSAEVNGVDIKELELEDE